MSQYSAKSGGYWICGSRDIKLLVFPVILQDHAIKASCD